MGHGRAHNALILADQQIELSFNSGDKVCVGLTVRSGSGRELTHPQFGFTRISLLDLPPTAISTN